MERISESLEADLKQIVNKLGCPEHLMKNIVTTEPLHHTGPINNAEDLAEEFLRWCEFYHPMKKFWDKQNQENQKNGSENYPYDAFRDIIKGRLRVMITDFNEKIKNK